MLKYRCSVCGYVHEGELPDDFKCPKCNQPASVFVLVEENRIGKQVCRHKDREEFDGSICR